MAGRHPKPRGTTTQPGYWSAKRALERFGTHAIDGRTRVAKALDQFRDELVADLGGPVAVSKQQLVVINLALRTHLLLESLDAFILKMDSPVNKRRRSVYPIVRERMQLSDSLARYMGMLGLERIPLPISDRFSRANEELRKLIESKEDDGESEKSDETPSA
jgi:hypothetical protein